MSEHNPEIPSQLDRFVTIVLRHRWLIGALAMVVMLVAAGGLRSIIITSDYRMMFGEDDPRLATFDALERT